MGVGDADGTQLKIVDSIRNNIRPQTLGLFDVVQDQIDGKDIIRVIVSCGQQLNNSLKVLICGKVAVGLTMPLIYLLMKMVCRLRLQCMPEQIK